MNTRIDNKTRMELAAEVYRINMRNGFHEQEFSLEQGLALVCCELAEAIEADREDRRANMDALHKAMENPGPHEAATPEEQYAYWFRQYVKDSLEDELADAYIRCLDLVVMFDVKAGEWPPLPRETYTGYNFTERVYQIMAMATMGVARNFKFRHLVGMLEQLAGDMDIDLQAYVRAKMRYNETRPYKHGKKY